MRRAALERPFFRLVYLYLFNRNKVNDFLHTTVKHCGRIPTQQISNMGVLSRLASKGKVGEIEASLALMSAALAGMALQSSNFSKA